MRSTEIGEWINPFVGVMVEKARDHIESILNLHIWFKKLVTSDEKDQVTWEEVNNNIVDEFLANQKDIEEKLGWAAELGQRRYIYCLFPFLQVARARETTLQLEKENLNFHLPMWKEMLLTIEDLEIYPLQEEKVSTTRLH